MTNMVTLSIILGSFLATAAAAYPSLSHPEIPSGQCNDYFITLPVTSENFISTFPPFKDNYDVAEWLFNTSRKDTQTAFLPFSDTKNVTKKYTISATFCTPKTTKHGKENTVLLATHGLGYDGRYWAPSYKPEEYSFVEYALKAGYSTFVYDRLGVGKSQKESGFVAQSSQAIAILSQLATSIKAGKYTGSIKTKKLVFVGHSAGSYYSNGALAVQPDLADAVVLTGMAYPGHDDEASRAGRFIPTAFAARIASTVNPKRFPASTWDTGYTFFADMYAHVDTFLRTYDRDVAEYTWTIVQPASVLEFETLGAIPLAAPSYKGKVLIASGEFDLGPCAGECYSTFATGTQNITFSGATKLETYVHPGAGHGVNFNKNATGFFEAITTFLDKNL